MPDSHLGDVLSALVDGELTADEEVAARHHLDGCDACRDELAATEATAALVRGLPGVDAPFGFYERLLRRRGFAASDRRRLRVGLAVATTAAAVALVVGMVANLSEAEVAPAVDDMVEVHQAGFVPSSGFDEMAPDEEPAAEVPIELGDGFERQAVYERTSDDVVAVTYRSGSHRVSVFEQAGDLDPDGLAPAMESMADDAWAMEAGDLHAVVIDRGRVVYTVVSDASMGEMLVVAGDLPAAGPPSLLQRARYAGAEVVWTFGLGT